jgi:hydroxymethylpyrimidine/phosphomethylpyrimidine kinase
MAGRRRVALTVAGSDSGGGAGIQADCRVFFLLGIHPTCALTSVTAQNTRGVWDRFDLPPKLVAAQMEAVFSDFPVDAAKTGMLAREETVRVVADALKGRSGLPLVVDPVLRSSTGQELLDPGGLEAMKEELLPLATVFTPNLEEASALLGEEVGNLKAMRNAAAALLELGPRCVVVKGGHLGGGEAADVFYDGRRMEVLSGERIPTPHDHGTGCVFSAGVAGGLALGDDPLQAVKRARSLVRAALLNSLDLGGGRGPVFPVYLP